MPRLEKQIGTQWLPITDERSPAERKPGYYLDGSYVGPSYNEGCDVRGCTQLPAALPVAQAAEFVRTGMRNDPRGQPVVQLEKRPLTGPVRVAAKLHANARCDGAVPGIFELPRP